MIKKLAFVAVAVLLASIAFFSYRNAMDQQAVPLKNGQSHPLETSGAGESEQRIADLVNNEVLLREVKPILKKIGRSIGNLAFPDLQTRPLYTEDFTFEQQNDEDQGRGQ